MANQLHDQIVREIRERVDNGEANQVLQALHTCNANSLDDVDEADYPRLLDLLQRRDPRTPHLFRKMSFLTRRMIR